jgi:serpin B
MRNKQIFDSWNKIGLGSAADARIKCAILARNKEKEKYPMIKNRMRRRLAAVAACLALIVTVTAVFGNNAGWFGGHIIQAADLMEGVSPNQVDGKPADSAFTQSMANFSLELFKKSVTEKENSLISPLSVMLALAMTANGADGETLAQMEALLGGGIPLAALNEYLYSYVKNLPSEEKAKLGIANSIWFRDCSGLQVKQDFLQANADYYSAAAYRSAFDAGTLKDINNWVKTNTDGMIDSILDEISDTAMLYLINAVIFDAEWESVYYKENVLEGDFTNIGGQKQSIDFMHSEETLYLNDGKATGFIKPYMGGRYSFAALLPNEDVPIEAYIQTLTGAGLISMINNAENTSVNASMPKFSYEYDIEMNEALIALGMPNAFDDKADFSRMAELDLFISKVRHKTFIEVDELGTKAGAVTKVEMEKLGLPMQEKTVRLDRPFVYAITDNATGLPVFIGTVMTV